MVNQAIMLDSVINGSHTCCGCDWVCEGEGEEQECFTDCTEGQTRLANIIKNHLNVIESTNHDEFVTADGMYFQALDGGNVLVDVNGPKKSGGVFVLSHFDNLKEFRPSNHIFNTGEDLDEYYYNNL